MLDRCGGCSYKGGISNINPQIKTMFKELTDKLKAKFKAEYAEGKVEPAEQELRMYLLTYAGTEEALERWLREKLDAGVVSIEQVEEYMPLWDGYIDAMDPSFVVRYEADKARKAGNTEVFVY